MNVQDLEGGLPWLKRGKVLTAPRVGLSLNRYDEFKEKFWMCEYRYSSMPKFQKKFGNQFALPLIRDGMALDKVCQLCNLKMPAAAELRAGF
jgi:hypothetical protein